MIHGDDRSALAEINLKREHESFFRRASLPHSLKRSSQFAVKRALRSPRPENKNMGVLSPF